MTTSSTALALPVPDAALAVRLRDRMAVVEEALAGHIRSRAPFVTEAASHLMEAGELKRAAASGGPELPNVVPFFARESRVPAAYERAARTRVGDERYLEFSLVEKTFATPKGPLTEEVDIEPPSRQRPDQAYYPAAPGAGDDGRGPRPPQ